MQPIAFGAMSVTPSVTSNTQRKKPTAKSQDSLTQRIITTDRQVLELDREATAYGLQAWKHAKAGRVRLAAVVQNWANDKFAALENLRRDLDKR